MVDDALLGQNQAELDASVGPPATTSATSSPGPAAGLAQVGGTCTDGAKGRGGTAMPDPVGDPFDVDRFTHVVGHQLGAHHTFNGTTGGCGTGRDAATAYEPGSGSTIMGLPGQCGAEDVQPNADDYFHGASFDEIAGLPRRRRRGLRHRDAHRQRRPLVAAGPDLTIPRGTPFTLSASATDPDADPLTFCWEQFDLGAATPPPNMADGPLFRSRRPVASPARTFPAMADLLAGGPTPGSGCPRWTGTSPSA